MNFAPIGVFCLIASTFATTGWDAFIPLLKYMGAVLLALFIQASGTYMAMLSIFAQLNPIRFFKNFAPVMNLAFSTASSNASIPLNIETMENVWVFLNPLLRLQFPLVQQLTWMEQLYVLVNCICSSCIPFAVCTFFVWRQNGYAAFVFIEIPRNTDSDMGIQPQTLADTGSGSPTVSIPELIQLMSGKSMIRYFPPNATAGFATFSVSTPRRLP